MNEPTSVPRATLPGATSAALSLPGLSAALVLLVLAVTFTVNGALGERADGLYLFIPLAAVLGTAINALLVRGHLPRRMYGPLLGTAIPAVIGLSVLLHFSLDHLWLPALFVWLALSRLTRPQKRR